MPTLRRSQSGRNEVSASCSSKRVAPGEQEAVEVSAAQQRFADFPFVHAGPDGPHRARGSKLLERAVATAIEELADARGATRSRDPWLITSTSCTNRMSMRSCPRRSQTRVVRPHHTVVRVVVVEGPPGRVEKVARRRLAWTAVAQQPADLRREHVVAPRPRAQGRGQTVPRTTPTPYCGAVSNTRSPASHAASSVAPASASLIAAYMFPSGAPPKPITVNGSGPVGVDKSRVGSISVCCIG